VVFGQLTGSSALEPAHNHLIPAVTGKQPGKIMNIHETAILDTVKNVNTFGTTNAADFTATSSGGKQFAIIAAAVPAESDLGAQEVSGQNQMKAGVKSKAVAYKQIYDDLADVAKAAHSLALLGTIEGIGRAFLMPRNHGAQDILSAARAFKKDAQPFAPQFADMGLDADFFTAMDGHITDFENAIAAKGKGKGDLGGGVGGMADTAHQAAIALHVLDTVVRNKYSDDPEKLAEWTIASHVEKHTPVPRTKPAATPAK
jgi:hypothetical protein